MSGSTGVVSFNYGEWATLFPEFSNLSQSQATLYFGLAQQWCDNTISSPVGDYSLGGMRDTYLNLVTAHVAMLLAGAASQPASQSVGRVSAASEGSVSATLYMPEAKSSAEAFFSQTKYGLMFWTATAQYRYGGLYMPSPTCGAQQVLVTGSQFPGSLAVSIPGWFN